jgi:hypothetical protein
VNWEAPVELEDAAGREPTELEETVGRTPTELEEAPGRTTSELEDRPTGGRAASELEFAPGTVATELEEAVCCAAAKFEASLTSEQAVIRTTAAIGRIIFFIFDLLISFPIRYQFPDPKARGANRILKSTVSTVFYTFLLQFYIKNRIFQFMNKHLRCKLFVSDFLRQNAAFHTLPTHF